MVNPNGNLAVSTKSGVVAAFGSSRDIYKNVRFTLHLKAKETKCPPPYATQKQTWNLVVGRNTVTLQLLTKSGKRNGIDSSEILALGSGNLVPSKDLIPIIEGFVVALQLKSDAIQFQGIFYNKNMIL